MSKEPFYLQKSNTGNQQNQDSILDIISCRDSGKSSKKKVFDVKDFGAISDGVTVTTKKLQKAIDACADLGGGVVFFPAGQYVTGTLFLHDNINLHLVSGAVLLGSSNIHDYAADIRGCSFKLEPHLDKCLIYAEKVRNVAITGNGTIDGRGYNFKLASENDESSAKDRPMLIRFYRSKNIDIYNIKLQNAAGWCVNLVSSEDIKVSGITINNRVNRNNDGIDIDECHHVSISNSNFSCSDDAICFHNNTSNEKACENINISNCFISSRWSAIRSGAACKGGIRNVTVSNCTIYDTFGSAIKLQVSCGARMENILFNNIIMDNVTGPITMQLGKHWYNVDQEYEECELGGLRNVTFTNIKASVAEKPSPSAIEYPAMPGEEKSCILILGSIEKKIDGITFSNIFVEYPGGGTAEEAERRISDIDEFKYPEYFNLGVLPSYGMYMKNAENIFLENVQFTVAKADFRPAILFDNVHSTVLSNFRCQQSPKAGSLLFFRDCKNIDVKNNIFTEKKPKCIIIEGKETEKIVLGYKKEMICISKEVDSGQIKSG